MAIKALFDRKRVDQIRRLLDEGKGGLFRAKDPAPPPALPEPAVDEEAVRKKLARLAQSLPPPAAVADDDIMRDGDTPEENRRSVASVKRIKADFEQEMDRFRRLKADSERAGTEMKGLVLGARLIVAVERGDLSSVSAALADGADPNADDRCIRPDASSHETALQLARKGGHTEIAAALRKQGAK